MAVMPAGTLPGSRGTSAWVNPSRAASASRRAVPVTRRISPASPTSPMATRPVASGSLFVDPATARATARSVAGSVSRTPPTVAAYTSQAATAIEARRCRTASTIASRPLSRPLVVRRGLVSTDGIARACTSATSGRLPSIVTVTQVPGTASRRWDRNSPLGSASPSMPSSERSKQPTSSAGP